MARIFDVYEIFKFAIQIEKNGERFYRTYGPKIKEEKVRKLFEVLADDEVKHRAVFEKMLDSVRPYEPAETYPGEYYKYLRAYVENIVFPTRRLDLEIKKMKTVSAALDFAIRRELESILYYTEMKNFIPPDQHQTIDMIINEERSHYFRLRGQSPKDKL